MTGTSASMPAKGSFLTSARTRLIALVLAVLLPALCAAAWVLGLTYRMERESSEHVLEETTRALSMVLDRELTQRAVVVRALASSSLLDTAPRLSPAALRDFDQQARRTLTGLEGWLELRNADQVLVNTRLAAVNAKVTASTSAELHCNCLASVPARSATRRW